MKDKRIAELNDAIETEFLEQVLQDRGLPFRIEKCEGSYFGVYGGVGMVAGTQNQYPTMLPYAYVWGYMGDAEDILLALAEVRHAQPQGAETLPRPAMYRIKKS